MGHCCPKYAEDDAYYWMYLHEKLEKKKYQKELLHPKYKKTLIRKHQRSQSWPNDKTITKKKYH